MFEPSVPLEPRNDPFYHAFANTAQIVFKRFLHFETLTSTNEYIKNQGVAGEPEGLVVLADVQTAGIGRFTRYWHSPQGGLYFSLLLRPSTLKVDEVPLINLTTSVAIAKVLKDAYGISASLKWPNDVLVQDRKIAGILAEQQILGDTPLFVIIGIGINVNISISSFPPDLQPNVTSIQELLGKPVELPRLFSYFMGQIEYWYLKLRDQGFAAIAPHWRQLCLHLNKPIQIAIKEESITGISIDITNDGSLILLTDTGRKIIRTGDVTNLQLKNQD